jgi:hypothetical protein
MSIRKGLLLAATFAVLAVTPAFAVSPLCEGIEACELDWITIPDGAWFYQTAVSYDGVDALQSSPTADDELSGLVTEITGPASVSFMAKTSTEEDADYLVLLIDGEVSGQISGENDWFPIDFDLPAGTFQVGIGYAKSESGSAGDDTVWIDNFVVSPTGGIVINNGAASTGSANVTLNLNWASGTSRVTRMRFSNNGSTWSAWEPLASTKAWALAPGEGYRTVRVQYRDIDGNVSPATSDYIKVDMTAPTGGIVINGGDWITLNLNVILDLSWADAGSGVSRMRFSNNGSTWSAWEAVAPTKAWALSAWGVRTVRVQFIDRAGNVSAVYSDYINALT